MCPRRGTRPPSPLPPIHPHQLRLTVIFQRNNTIDLSVGMLMILASIRLLGVHIHGRDAEVAGERTRERDLRAPIFGAIDGDGRTPAFVVGEALTHQRRNGSVE